MTAMVLIVRCVEHGCALCNLAKLNYAAYLRCSFTPSLWLWSLLLSDFMSYLLAGSREVS